MLLAPSTHATKTSDKPGILSGSAAAQMLARGDLGSRLIQAARLAAAIHMAQSATPRNDGAHIVPRAEAAQ